MLTIKRNFVWVLFAFAVILFFVKFAPFDKLNNRSEPYYETMQINNGWGYNIYKNDSLYIHQMYIPALEGMKNFKTEQDAKKVASLVVKKLLKSRFPSITINELDSLKIEL